MGFSYIVESTRFSKHLYTVIGEMSWTGLNPLAPSLRRETPTYICHSLVNGKLKTTLIQLGPKHTTYGPGQFEELRGMGFFGDQGCRYILPRKTTPIAKEEVE